MGNAKRKCHHCRADFQDIQTLFEDASFVLCNRFLHLQHGEENEALRTHLSEEHGKTRETVLLDAPYFDVMQQFPEDIMHVILEGALLRTL